MQIRARVIDYMREHANYYKQFIEVHPGGGIRRNPKRKNAGGYSSSTSKAAASQPLPPPSPAAVDRVFESHLARMARGGTYGDHLEISAFAAAFATDVKIYQRDFAYVVSPPAAMITPSETDEHDPSSTTTSPFARPTAHIAYHLWEHYSSIRNLAGPHSGPPCVAARVLTEEEERQQKEKLAQAPAVLPWQIDIVAKSLPFLADKPTIKRALEAARGNIDLAVSRLLDADEADAASGGSTSRSFSSGGEAASWQGSSSVERDADSGDEEDGEEADGTYGRRGRKKQDRRLSRASRRGGLHAGGGTGHGHLTHLAPLSAASRESLHSAVSAAGTDGSESAGGGGGGGGDAASFTFSFTSSSQPGSSTQPSSVEDYSSSTSSPASTVKPSGGASFSSSSATTSTSIPGSKPTVRLKLLPPKKPPPETAATTLDDLPTFTANASSLPGAKPAHPPPPRLAARDKKNIKKLAQKAARKERQQLAAGLVVSPGGTARQLPLRQGPPLPPAAAAPPGVDGAGGPGKGGPVVMETLRTLYI